MNRIKLFAVTLVLSVTGVVYAASDHDHAKHKAQSCDKAAASCCAEHKHSGETADKKESCCQPGASCCAARKARDKKDDARASAVQKEGESCCVGGADCCEGGSCCVKHGR